MLADEIPSAYAEGVGGESRPERIAPLEERREFGFVETVGPIDRDEGGEPFESERSPEAADGLVGGACKRCEVCHQRADGDDRDRRQRPPVALNRNQSKRVRRAPERQHPPKLPHYFDLIQNNATVSV